MTARINDRWPHGGNTEAMKKKKKTTESVKTLLDIPPLHCALECVVLLCVKSLFPTFKTLLGCFFFMSVVLQSKSSNSTVLFRFLVQHSGVG